MFLGTFHPELRSIDLNQFGTFKIRIKIDVPLPKQMITNVHKALESTLSASIFSNLLPYMFLISAYVHMCTYVCIYIRVHAVIWIKQL